MFATHNRDRHHSCKAVADLLYFNSSFWRSIAWCECNARVFLAIYLRSTLTRSRAGPQAMHASRILRQFSASTSLQRTLRTFSRHASGRQQGARLKSTATLTYVVMRDQKGALALRCQSAFRDCASTSIQGAWRTLQPFWCMQRAVEASIRHQIWRLVMCFVICDA